MLQLIIAPLAGRPVNVWRTIYTWFMPWVALITISGGPTDSRSCFLLGGTHATLPLELCGGWRCSISATRWQIFAASPGSLIWPGDPYYRSPFQLDPAAQDLLIEVYLSARRRGAPRLTMVLIAVYTLSRRSRRNSGGYAATIAVAVFVIVVVFPLLQYQLLRLEILH